MCYISDKDIDEEYEYRQAAVISEVGGLDIILKRLAEGWDKIFLPFVDIIEVGVFGEGEHVCDVGDFVLSLPVEQVAAFDGKTRVVLHTYCS